MSRVVIEEQKTSIQYMLLFTVVFVALVIGTPGQAVGQTFTINVAGADGAPLNDNGAPIGYRWLLEADATRHVVPGDPSTNIALEFHTSYMPVATSGHSTDGSSVVINDPIVARFAGEGYDHFYVSVLPDAGYSIGGAAVAPGQTEVTVTVNPLPLPTAQITVFVFHDAHPTNTIPDLPEEYPGLANFQIVLEDAAGKYGQNGGMMMMDAFANPLGTSYQRDANGNYILDADGAPIVDVMGDGVILTDANGEAVIKNLFPGKFGVQAIPPAGQGWIQTSTIEGKKVIDAWVKSNEPPYFAEFGPPGWHVFIGFVKQTEDLSALTGSTEVTGQVVNLHLSRPPDTAFYNGAPYAHTRPWVALNDLAAGSGSVIFAGPCEDDGTFSIQGVAPGQYQLVVWDENLDLVVALLGLTLTPEEGPVKALGDVPVFNWFSRLENWVFHDANENGFWDVDDPLEFGIPEQAVNLRFRDGTIYQSFPTDSDGFVPFDEVFPFFSWLVMEVDYARFKATGATFVVDAGGPIDSSDPWTFDGQLNPQDQDADTPGVQPSRTEIGPVLTQGFQGFLGQTSVAMWGKKAYGPSENGGISGIVYYAITRAEDDPQYAAAEGWEPGIPRVQVNLYQDVDRDGVIDDLNGDGGPTLSDVDNFPFGWDADHPLLMGPEDVDRSGDVGTFDPGDAIQITTTDSWDDNVPSGAPGDPADPFYNGGKGYDGMRIWNQIRPGVFDGGYAFNDLNSGVYIVEAVPPPGYELLKEEDRNIDFGDQYVPSTLLLPASCVGDPHLVPPELSLFPGIPASYAGEWRPLSDRKQVILTQGSNAAADFFMFTEVPIAGHIFGIILDDTSNEFDPNSPQFGEKYAPPWLPISIRDWTGREISRVYSDEWGRYNALVPSTYTVNIAVPSGVSPNMITVNLNDPGPIPDPDNPGQFIDDPFFNPQYSQFSYTLQYMPGSTTYLDTPVVPVAAFAGPDKFPVDCEFPDGTPRIYSVSGPDGGPYVSAPGAEITIQSVGTIDVLNPAYDGPNGSEPRLISRDYGFGINQGSVTINGVLLQNVTWTDDTIIGTVAPSTKTGQLEVIRENGEATIVGLTVTVGGPAPIHVSPGPGTPIQDAIDSANPNDLILVEPGIYEEMVIMWKPVKLQGWGASSTTIKAINTPAEKLAAWLEKVEDLVVIQQVVDPLPSQEIGFGGVEPVTFFTEQGAGVFVLSKDVNVNQGGFGLVKGIPNARIDGLTVTGSSMGGGIVINGYAHNLVVSNNRVANNTGFFAGGIRIGHPTLFEETNDGLVYTNAENEGIAIRHNHIKQNGSLGEAGGGIGIHTGSDNYSVTDNYITGNFTAGEGGGIGHLGLSDEGLIARNTINYNESFSQGVTVSGGGILIAGGVPIGLQTLSEGSGSVRIEQNLIQSNLAGAGDGGGIRLERVNGLDVNKQKNNTGKWYKVSIIDNMIVNNVTALAGGGISLQDAALVDILHNTIANNDSTATAGEAFQAGSPNQSTPQPAGIVSRAHSPALNAEFGNQTQADYGTFSQAKLDNNIIWHNRSFYFFGDPNEFPPVYQLLPDPNTPVFDDLAVLGTATIPADTLNPRYCILSETTDDTLYDGSNLYVDPLFVSEYFNGTRDSTVIIPEIKTAIQPAAAFDEGGNFIEVAFGPLTPTGDYHIQAGSPAVDAAEASAVSNDYDSELRPSGSGADIGADEVQQP